jgi:hypothetical protein
VEGEVARDSAGRAPSLASAPVDLYEVYRQRTRLPVTTAERSNTEFEVTVSQLRDALAWWGRPFTRWVSGGYHYNLVRLVRLTSVPTFGVSR